MRITFLGTGTSQGVPMIACDCAVCASSDPRNKRLRPSIYVETGDGTCFVVDTPPDFRQQCLVHNVRRVDAVVITHTHADHILGLDDLRRFNQIKRAAIPLYASAQSMEVLRRIFGYAFAASDSLKQGWAAVEPHEIDVPPLPRGNYAPFQIGSATLLPFAVPHGKVTTLGFLVGDRDGSKFAYITDVKEVPPPIEALVNSVPLLILGALRHSPHPAHMTVAEAVETVKHIQPLCAYFVHMTHELDYKETNKKLPLNTRLAHDGLKLEVGASGVREI
jgi:phosphoribosyl 1,2-cyclic phosphate phosphodiesterase